MKTRLTGINLLEQLERSDLAGLRKEFMPRTHLKGAMVFTPHHRENLVFVVTQGQARLFLAYGEKEFTLSILAPGDVYSTHTPAYVQALEDMTLLVMPTERFGDLLTRHPELTRTMVLVLGDILQSSLGIIHSLVFKDIPRRVAEFMHVAACEHGEPSGSGRRIRLGVTTEQLASIVGSTRQSVSEAMTRFERDGLVLREARGVFFIPDLCALEAFAAEE